jgi:hypothetical protein
MNYSIVIVQNLLQQRECLVGSFAFYRLKKFFVEVMVHGKMCDILVIPGGEEITHDEGKACVQICQHGVARRVGNGYVEGY